jgi:hypothetical protein
MFHCQWYHVDTIKSFHDHDCVLKHIVHLKALRTYCMCETATHGSKLAPLLLLYCYSTAAVIVYSLILNSYSRIL